MSSHFNLKSLTFYGVAIGFVLLLFNVVTACTKPKAPAPIDGRYRLSILKICPTVLKDALVLDIEQSGIYLNGSLLPASTDAQRARAGEANLLEWSIQSSTAEFSWYSSQLNSCNNSFSTRNERSFQDNSPILVRIQSRVEGKTWQNDSKWHSRSDCLPPSEIPSNHLKTLAAIKALNAMPWY